ncbi:MAG TPA: Crp/Fnr family transcriptional regulator [Candidatus Acidoferrales bacterium]|nr:Crp/Fnr family transcriptional regulator [Candidatus Acidoferrales bacterium]
MKTPYGLHIIESCLNCPVHSQRLFCDLSPATLASLDAISTPSTYPRGAVLFVEGQEPRGVFVICNGRVKLTATAADGKSVIVRMADAGELVGLPGTISGKPYELTAEALEPIQANFIPRKEFLEFLKQRGEAALRVAEMLSEIYHDMTQEVRYLGLSHSAEEKLARFLLDLPPVPSREPGDTARATLTLTHEEIGGVIGSSRETVTRLFASFKKRSLVEVHGSTVIIRNKAGLEEIVES